MTKISPIRKELADSGIAVTVKLGLGKGADSDARLIDRLKRPTALEGIFRQRVEIGHPRRQSLAKNPQNLRVESCWTHRTG